MLPEVAAEDCWAAQDVLPLQFGEEAVSQPVLGCAAEMGAELHQKCGADPEPLLAVGAELVEELPDALVSADVKDAAVVVVVVHQLMGRTGPAAAPVAQFGCEADSAAFGFPVGEPIFAVVELEPGSSSVVSAEPVTEPCSSVAKPVDEALFESAALSLDES